MKNRKKQNKRVPRCGFTIQEILIALGLIALAAVVITPFVSDNQSEGTDNASFASRRGLQTAIDDFVGDNGSIPSTWLDGLNTGDDTTTGIITATGKVNLLASISTFGADQKLDVASMDGNNFQAVYISAGSGRIKVVQYCIKLTTAGVPDANVVNIDKTLSTAFNTTSIPQNTTTNAAISTILGGTAWPYN